jgi:hypothetical protein
MTKCDELTTDIVADELLAQLSRLGWKFNVKHNQTFFDPDWNEFNGFNKSGPLGTAATELRVILISLNRKSTSVEIRFLFRMVDFNKRRLAMKWRENDFEVLRTFCNEVLEKIGIKAKEEDIIPSPRTQSEVELVYWKKPLKQPTN